MSGQLHELAVRSAERSADAPAVVLDGETLTYEQLVVGARKLGRYLATECGVGRGDRVVLLAAKSPAAVLGMHAVLEAGGAYVPVDVASPAARAARVVTAAAPRAVLVGPGTGDLVQVLHELGCLENVALVGLEPGGGDIPDSMGGFDDWRTLSGAALPTVGDPDDLAHLLFTSGSTGAPKGVQITHRTVQAFLDWALPHFGTAAGDRVSGHPPLHFDLSTFDIYGSLAAGAQLHLVSAKANLHPASLASFIRDNDLTQWFSVPSTLAYLARADVVGQDDFPSLRRVLFCGEPMPMPVLRHWMRRVPHARFTNLYGPTEATIASTYYDVPELPASDTLPVPIGVPCAGEQALLLDEDYQPVPVGEIGHLFLGGAGLSPGYWRDDAQTAAAFLPHPEGPDQRIYRTGDLARLDETGLLQFVGRRDSQIKHRGYRIELGEIEAALAALDAIGEAAVTAVPTEGFAGNEICCAYVPSSTEVSALQLRMSLSDAVPPYMIPTQWRAYEALPKNQNGKTDRRALQEHFTAARGGTRAQ